MFFSVLCKLLLVFISPEASHGVHHDFLPRDVIHELNGVAVYLSALNSVLICSGCSLIYEDYFVPNLWEAASVDLSVFCGFLR